MSLPASIRDRLRLPVVAAPMFLVSGPALVRAAQEAGIVGAFPANNARSIDMLDAWMGEIAGAASPDAPPWALNVMTHRTYARLGEELEVVARWKPPIVITALGGPGPVLETVKAYGGLVFADVNSITYAQKAVKAGADGLVLVASGAGGHTGALSAFAFVSAVRQFFDGPICLGGGIGTGRAVRAAEVLGADLAYMGTRFIACTESLAEPAYKAMLIEANAEQIVLSAALTGAPANWLRASLEAAGFDPAALGPKADIALGRPEDAAKKRWRDVWSAGHGVGAVHGVEPLAAIVDELARDYAAAGGAPTPTPSA